MPMLESKRSYRQIETVIDLAVALVDYTHTAQECREIPAFLGATFGIADVTLAVIDKGPLGERSRISMCHTTVPREKGEDEQVLHCQLLDLHRRFKVETAQEQSEFVHMLHARQRPGGAESPADPSVETVVFARGIDKEHDLLLMICRGAGAARFPFDVIEDLHILTNELSKQLKCMMEWYRSESMLGKPFSDLTKVEWSVLRSLTSGGSEKELAAQLNMAPHSLHGRIKSIYRKLQVQGRLPLIQKFNAAVSERRIALHRVRAGEVAQGIEHNRTAEDESPAVKVAEGVMET